MSGDKGLNFDKPAPLNMEELAGATGILPQSRELRGRRKAESAAIQRELDTLFVQGALGALLSRKAWPVYGVMFASAMSLFQDVQTAHAMGIDSPSHMGLDTSGHLNDASFDSVHVPLGHGDVLPASVTEIGGDPSEAVSGAAQGPDAHFVPSWGLGETAPEMKVLTADSLPQLADWTETLISGNPVLAEAIQNGQIIEHHTFFLQLTENEQTAHQATGSIPVTLYTRADGSTFSTAAFAVDDYESGDQASGKLSLPRPSATVGRLALLRNVTPESVTDQRWGILQADDSFTDLITIHLSPDGSAEGADVLFHDPTTGGYKSIHRGVVNQPDSAGVFEISYTTGVGDQLETTITPTPSEQPTVAPTETVISQEIMTLEDWRNEVFSGTVDAYGVNNYRIDAIWRQDATDILSDPDIIANLPNNTRLTILNPSGEITVWANPDVAAEKARGGAIIIVPKDKDNTWIVRQAMQAAFKQYQLGKKNVYVDFGTYDYDAVAGGERIALMLSDIPAVTTNDGIISPVLRMPPYFYIQGYDQDGNYKIISPSEAGITDPILWLQQLQAGGYDNLVVVPDQAASGQ